MLLVLSAQFGLPGARLNAAFTVEAHVVVIDDGVSCDDGAVFVHVGNMHAAEVRHRAVIGECSSAPLTTREPDDAQIEVAIEALALARAGDVGVAGTAPLTLAS